MNIHTINIINMNIHTINIHNMNIHTININNMNIKQISNEPSIVDVQGTPDGTGLAGKAIWVFPKIKVYRGYIGVILG